MKKFFLVCLVILTFSVEALRQLPWGLLYALSLPFYPVAWVWGVSFKRYHNEVVYVLFPDYPNFLIKEI